MGIEEQTETLIVTETASSANQLPFTPDVEPEQLQASQKKTASQFDKDCYFSDSMKSGGQGPELAVIPAGLFAMGSTPDEHGHQKHESPQHYVSINQVFAIGRHTVTATEYDRFREATHWRLRPELLWSTGNKPVMNIRIDDARLYLQWLSEETEQLYRLPTEAEWEYATRAGTATPFHFGDNVSCKEVHFDALSPYLPKTHETDHKNSDWKKWFKLPRLPKCLPIPVSIEVGSKPANLWGLYEVHGNVWEFTDSPWTASHINANRDGSASPSNLNKWHVTKGGSWFDSAIHARSASRMKRHFEEMDTNLGFRVVRELRDGAIINPPIITPPLR